jgi:hypothetical protein
MDANPTPFLYHHPANIMHDFTGLRQAKIDAPYERKLHAAINNLGADRVHAVDVNEVWKTLREFANNISAKTVRLPRGAEAVGKFMDDLFTPFDEHGKRLSGKALEKHLQEARYLSFHIAARDLAKVHPGVSSVPGAKHLHPYNPGLATSSSYDDEELVTIVWKYPKPKSNQIHAEPLVLTDGTLIAAFLTKDAPKAKWKLFYKHQDKVFDYLCGNKHALVPSDLKRAYHGSVHRFHSYFRGMNEGMSVPRFNGSIGANLLLTSLPISALLYCFIYAIDYIVTNRNLEKHKLNHYAHNVSAAASADSQTMQAQLSQWLYHNKDDNQDAPPPYSAYGSPPPYMAPPPYAAAVGNPAYPNGKSPVYGFGQSMSAQGINPGVTA